MCANVRIVTRPHRAARAPQAMLCPRALLPRVARRALLHTTSRAAKAEAQTSSITFPSTGPGLSALFNKKTPTTASLLDVTPITGSLGAEVRGIQLHKDLSQAEVDEVQRLFLEHSVLVFRDQRISAVDMLRVAELFGEPEERPVVKAQYGLEQVHELVREPNTAGKYGEVWHHDCSYMHTPPLGALLYGVEVPPYGNDTVFASMYLAFDALSPALQRLLEPLYAVHSAFKKVTKDPQASYLPYDDVEHPVVRLHPQTGRKALFVNSFFAKRFVGMTEEESAPLLEYLFSLAMRPELQCRVRWEPGSLTVWDNRCTQHMAIRDNTEHRRVMRRVEIKGDTPIPAATMHE